MSLLTQIRIPSNGKATMSDVLFGRLRAFIYDKTGIYFKDNKKYLLESRVGRRVEELGLKGYEAYLQHVQGGGLHRELPELVNAVTINETSFFRSPAQFDLIVGEMIPAIIKQGNKRRVRIWSAACSTGDEPYTFAILIKEVLQKQYPRVQFEVFGTDINTDVLQSAAKGLYSARAVRTVPSAYLNRYFVKEGNRYRLDENIRRMVNFKHLNLMDARGMSALRGTDIILCANVLIYFDLASKQQVVSGFYDTLALGGYLMVGFSETLYGVTQALAPVRFGKTIAYKKGGHHG